MPTTTHVCSACGGDLGAEWQELLAAMDATGISADGELLCAACDEPIPTLAFEGTERP
jgi:hypothetical protein